MCVVEGVRPSPEKILFFVPKNDKLGCILTQFLTGRKHGQSLEAWGYVFYTSIAKQSLQKQCKNYQKVHGQTKGGRSHHRPPPPFEYTTAVTQVYDVEQL